MRIIKVRVQEFSVKYCCKRSNEYAVVMDLLETKISALDKLIKSDSIDEELILAKNSVFCFHINHVLILANIP